MKIFKIVFIIIPNLPFITIIALYVLYKITKETGLVEIQMINSEDVLTDKIKKHILKLLPSVLMNCIALIFWLYIILKYIL